MSFSSKRTITINESILSLLLQLHSKLSEKPDSYQPKANSVSTVDESRIGDGVMFVERLLDIITLSSHEKMQDVLNIKQRLWPSRDLAHGSPSMENVDKEERLVYCVLSFFLYYSKKNCKIHVLLIIVKIVIKNVF